MERGYSVGRCFIMGFTPQSVFCSYTGCSEFKWKQLIDTIFSVINEHYKEKNCNRHLDEMLRNHFSTQNTPCLALSHVYNPNDLDLISKLIHKFRLYKYPNERLVRQVHLIRCPPNTYSSWMLMHLVRTFLVLATAQVFLGYPQDMQLCTKVGIEFETSR